MSVVQVKDEKDFFGKIGQTVDVVASKLGGKVLSFSDQWFAEADNLLKSAPPVFERVFIPTGLKMDGWETRRHNPQPFDWAILKLGVDSAKLIGCEVDTAFFVGNYAPAISVEGTFVNHESELASAQWEPIVERIDCGPSAKYFFVREEGLTIKAYSHVRLCQYPDGGIARFRLYGQPTAVFPKDKSVVLDLASISNGGVALAASDVTYGNPGDLLLPGRGIDQEDAWQTARTRGEHYDWAIIKLGAPGRINKIVVDTAFFIGNCPLKAAIQGINSSTDDIKESDSKWVDILEPSETAPDAENEFPIKNDNVVTHVKLKMIPDGGMKRLRVFGTRA
ncbi:allantoicase [Trichomonascus vanleenenianus]|uniref:allantoicase n=1 Tax=Trichomonascus vanleenenianus TaxID=2268995 RepID=UPI003EC9779B